MRVSHPKLAPLSSLRNSLKNSLETHIFSGLIINSISVRNEWYLFFFFTELNTKPCLIVLIVKLFF